MSFRNVALVFAGFALGACSHPAVHVNNPGPAVLPSGWTLAEDPQTGVKVGVPPGWRAGADTAGSLMGLASGAADMSQPTGADSELNNLQGQINAQSEQQEKEALAKLREKGIVLHIIDSSKPTPGEERTRYYVLKTDHDGNWTREAARDDEVEYYKGWGAEAPKSVTLPIGPGYKITADYKTRGGDEVERISYVAVDGSSTYVLRFISTNNPQAVLSIADDVAKTWRISPSAGKN